MSESKIISPSPNGPNTVKVGATFTGDVYLSMLHQEDSAAMAHVTFTPCARTHWHTHKDGQFLQVLHGEGWICDKGASPRKIKAGDLIWAPPGTTHWHGADEKSIMTHLAVGVGATVWGEKVTDEEFSKAGK